MKFVATVAIVAVLVSMTAGTLYIGKHYTASQAGDAIYKVNELAQDLDEAEWGNTMSRYKIDGAETWEFYDSNDYSGVPLFVVEGPVDWTWVNAAFNDRVSSVKLAAKVEHAATGTLTIGKHYTAQQRGDATYQVDKAQDLGKVGWDNTMSRYKIDGAETWEFYDSNDYSGTPLFVVKGPVDWTWVKSVYNDRVSSVKKPGPVLRLFRHYSGNDYIDIQGDTPEMPVGWDNTVSRAQALHGDWDLFDMSDFEGTHWVVNEGDTFRFKEIVENDKLSSANPRKEGTDTTSTSHYTAPHTLADTDNDYDIGTPVPESM